LGSDDGSRLFIDDKEVVINDGSHGFEEKSVELILEKGLHKFKLEYFQGDADMGLDVEIEYPGYEKSTIPRRWLFRTEN
ncbi:MAG: PA14 domain-containing protein, partial [Lentisphaeraceae bacterium]|nr:PA14 domain-containing protein [Lentisphaeraceae bacterium]